MQGLQRTDQLLNVIKSQLPSIAQASEMHGVNLIEFVNGAINRSGVQLDPAIAGVTAAIVALIGPPSSDPLPPATGA